MRRRGPAPAAAVAGIGDGAPGAAYLKGSLRCGTPSPMSTSKTKSYCLPSCICDPCETFPGPSVISPMRSQVADAVLHEYATPTPASLISLIAPSFDPGACSELGSSSLRLPGSPEEEEPFACDPPLDEDSRYFAFASASLPAAPAGAARAAALVKVLAAPSAQPVAKSPFGRKQAAHTHPGWSIACRHLRPATSQTRAVLSSLPDTSSPRDASALTA